MTSPRVVLSDEAKADLRSIEAYIASHDGDMRAAAFRARLEEAMINLAFMPGMGGRRSYLRSDRRAFSVSPWTIFYKQLPERDGIDIVRIVDERRDLPSVFKKKRRRPPPPS